MAELTAPTAADALSTGVRSTGDVVPGPVYGSSHDPAAMAAFGRFLEAARIAAGVTLEDLAVIVGPVREIERGKARTRPSRLRPWLERLGVDPDPVLERYAAVIAPEARDGRPRWSPKTPAPVEPPRPKLPPLPDYAQAALGAELWRMRARAGLERQVLAGVLGVSRMTVWLVERGARRPSEELLEAWLDEAGGPIDRQALALRYPGRIAARPRRPRVGAPGSDRSRTNGQFVATKGGSR